jgi:transposase
MYIVDQKVGNYIYVYEVRSYWDKDKKGARQQRVRIGKRDPDTGEFIKLEKKRRSREYGPVYLLASLVEQLGLKELLEEEFPSEAREIITAACFQIAEHKPFYLCGSWLEHIFLNEPIELSSQRISRLLQDIGEDERAIYRFLDAWAESREENEFIVFDITSVSTHGKGIDFAEWGYNRDGEKLTQVNIGMVYGEPSTLPLLYSLYPGSVPDVVTLKNMKKRLERIAKLRTLFVLDRGFYSGKNLGELSALGSFIIPLPMSTKAARELVQTHRNALSSADNAIRVGTQIYYRVSDGVEIRDTTYHAHLFYNEKQASDEHQRYLTFLLTVEEEVAEKNWPSAARLIRFLEDSRPGWQQSFRVVEGEDGYTVERKRDEIRQTTERHGVFILLTNTDIPAEQALEYYRRKDGVEKLFDTMKHGIDMKRLRVHSRTSVEGLLFIEFISLIVYSEILRVLRSTGLGKKMTVEQMFYELKKLSVIEIDEKKPMLTELTRKQKDIFEAFKIPLPMLT